MICDFHLGFTIPLLQLKMVRSGYTVHPYWEYFQVQIVDDVVFQHLNDLLQPDQKRMGYLRTSVIRIYHFFHFCYMQNSYIKI